MKTLAQKAADKGLEESVLRAIEAYKLLPPGHTMIDFVAVIEGMNIADESDEGDAPESLAMCFRSGVCRTTVAVGLLDLAKGMLTQGERVDSGEEA